MAGEANPNKRRLSRDEAVELLSRPLTGVFSSVSDGGWIHSVPVHFLSVKDQIRFVAGAQDAKTRNVERRGQGTLCVEVTEGSSRTYASVSGPATVQRPPDAADLRALDRRYSRVDFAEGWDDESFAAAAMITISVERWIARTYWD